jgi:hypothetical protein
MRVLLLSLSFVAATTVAGCTDDPDKLVHTATAPENVPPNAMSAFVTVSNPRAAAGDRVTVTVRALRGVAVGPIGSFRIRVLYDSTKLAFIETAPSSHGMVLANPAEAGNVIAAGASAAGFLDDRLVRATFRILRDDGLRSLALSVDELNSVMFEDQRPAMRVERSLYRSVEDQ